MLAGRFEQAVSLRAAALHLGGIFAHDARARRVILLVLAIDLAFILAHAATVLLQYFDATQSPLVQNHVLTVSREGGPAEIFNYVQTAACALLLGSLFARTRARVYALWAFVFALVVADDALGIHERGGGLLAASLRLSAPAGLRMQDVGEIAVWSAMGLVVAGVWLWARRAPGSQADRARGRLLGLAFALLVAFAFGVDVLHSAVHPDRWYLEHAFAIAEDGGEMLALGIAFALAILMVRADAEDRRPESAPTGAGT